MSLRYIGGYLTANPTNNTSVDGISSITQREYVPAIPPGQVEYTTPGTYSWVVPTNVTAMSAMCIGGGGGGHQVVSSTPGGGGGGGLSYCTPTPVIPGQTYTVVVGAAGVGSGTATAGGDSTIAFTYRTGTFSTLSQDTLPTDLVFDPTGTNVYVLGDTNNTVYQYSLSTPWQITTASFTGKTLSVALQDTSPVGLAFKTDGTVLYVLGSLVDTVFQYNLTTPWDISTGTYSGLSSGALSLVTLPASLNFSTDGLQMYAMQTTNQTFYQFELIKRLNLLAQDTTAQAITFRPDGLRMYILGQSADAIFEYTLTTAWDISTGSFSGNSFSIAAQELTGTGLAFSTDGTRMFVVGTTNRTVYTYTMATPWAIAGAVASGVNYSVASIDTAPSSLVFASDGTAFYIHGVTNDRVYAFTMSTPWDVSTAAPRPASWSASYFAPSGRQFAIGTQEASPTDVFFRDDGTRMYVVGTGVDTVFQYDLATAWDVSTAVYNNVSFSVAGQDLTPQGVFFGDNGSIMYMVGATNRRVYQYTLSTPWAVNSATFSKFFQLSDTAPNSVWFSGDGTWMFVLGNTNKLVYRFALSTAWDIATATASGQSPVLATGETAVTGMTFDPTGTSMYIVGTLLDRVQRYALSTAWDVSTATPTESGSVAALETAPVGIYYRPDGNFMYLVGSTNDTVYQAVPMDNLNVLAQDTAGGDFCFSTDGTRLFLVGNTADAIFQYDLSTPFQLISGTYSNKSLSVGLYEPVPTGLAANPNGNELFVCGTNNDRVVSFTLPTSWDLTGSSVTRTPWDVRGAFANGNLISVAAQDTAPTGTCFRPDGTRFFMVGTTTDAIYEYDLTTPWDLSTASFSFKRYLIGAFENLATGVAFSVDGSSAFFVGSAADQIQQLDLRMPWTFFDLAGSGGRPGTNAAGGAGGIGYGGTARFNGGSGARDTQINGVNGGGGAAGYSGNGGNGGSFGTPIGTAGTGGAAGGGAYGGGGGGINIYGEGASGIACNINTVRGENGSGMPRTEFVSRNGAAFGGGGGGNSTISPAVSIGGIGAVRIIWGDNRSYPSTNTRDY